MNPTTLAYTVAILAIGISQAGASEHGRGEPREAQIDLDVVVEPAAHGATAGRVHIAGDDSSKRRVRVTSSSGAVDSLPGFDIDAVISGAMADAFATASVSTGKTVKNAPYSAEVTTEKTQNLADGNQITKRTSTMTYRDSAGRTRQETRDSNGSIKAIQIHDPVEGTRLTLQPSTKTAHKTTADRDLSKRVAELKEKAKAMAKDGQATVIERSRPGEEIIIQRRESAADPASEVREDVQVRVIRSGASGPTLSLPKVGMAGPHEFPPLGDLMRFSSLGASLADAKWSAKATSSSLGTKDFDGVRAEGKSLSYSIPAGEIGNRNAIVVTTESWFSPELQATVYSRHSDPRSGETVYRMSAIKRSEPAASLFTVPEGYVVKENPAFSYQFRTEKK